MTEQEQMTKIMNLLNNAKKFGLEVEAEAVYYSLKSMKHSHIDPVSVMMQGCYEWDIPTTKIEE